MLGAGDVWSFDAGDERYGDWIENVELSIESAIVAGRAAATYNALHALGGEPGDPGQPEQTTHRLAKFAGLWTRSRLNEYILRELSCDFIATIAALVAVVDRGAALDLLHQHGEAAEGEWTEPDLCRCQAIASQIQTSDNWVTPWETHGPDDC